MEDFDEPIGSLEDFLKAEPILDLDMDKLMEGVDDYLDVGEAYDYDT